MDRGHSEPSLLVHGQKNTHVDKVDTIDTVHMVDSIDTVNIDTVDTKDAIDLGSDCSFLVIASLSHFLPLSSWISSTQLLSLRLISTRFYYCAPYYQNSELRIATAKWRMQRSGQIER